MVMNDLEQVMLTVFKHHEDALVFEDDFGQVDNVGMRQLCTQGHLPNGGL